MTTWGAYSNHMRVGLDFSTDAYTSTTPSINVYVTVSVQCDGTWSFDDDQAVSLTGSASGSWGFHNSLGPNATQNIATAVIPHQGQSYSGGPVYNFTATLTGNYLGGTSTVSASFTLPARPTRPPAAPGAPVFSNIGPTSATATWTGTPDYGGAVIDDYTLHVDTDAAMTQPWLMDLHGDSLSRTITGLTAGVTYYAQSFAHNAKGWSAGSAVRSFTTKPGAYVRVNGVWVNAPVQVRSGGAWVTPTIWKRVNGAWVQ